MPTVRRLLRADLDLLPEQEARVLGARGRALRVVLIAVFVVIITVVVLGLLPSATLWPELWRLDLFLLW